MKRESLRYMVFMITCGYVFPVLKYVISNISDLDQALLRHFVSTLFTSIAPPFSRRFISELVPLLTHGKVQIAIKSCSDDCKSGLRAFIQYSKGNNELISLENMQALLGIEDYME